jgi:F-type H+-transporting ATPase subunit a
VNVFLGLEHATGVPWVFWSALFAAAILLVTGYLMRTRLAAEGAVLPDEGLTVRNAFEILVAMLAGLAEQIMGAKWRTYFPFIATLFFFILLSNLMGLIPGLGGATSSADTTWAWAIISFAVHQYVGIREHGWSYLKNFLGPSLFDVTIGGRTIHVRLLAPLFIFVETMSHVARIFTLAVRLLANMFADHTVVAIWITLAPVLIPAAFMGLGLLVAFLQAYVFAMLSMIYIGLALEEPH